MSIGVRGRHSWLMGHNRQKRDPGCMKMRVRAEAGGKKTESELVSEGSGEPQQAVEQGLMGSDWPLGTFE